MSYKNLKKVYRMQDNIIGCLLTIKALLRVLHERNIGNYPANYLLTIVQRDEKSAAKKLYETIDILVKYVKR